MDKQKNSNYDFEIVEKANTVECRMVSGNMGSGLLNLIIDTVETFRKTNTRIFQDFWFDTLDSGDVRIKFSSRYNTVDIIKLIDYAKKIGNIDLMYFGFSLYNDR